LIVISRLVFNVLFHFINSTFTFFTHLQFPPFSLHLGEAVLRATGFPTQACLQDIIP